MFKFGCESFCTFDFRCSRLLGAPGTVTEKKEAKESRTWHHEWKSKRIWWNGAECGFWSHSLSRHSCDSFFFVSMKFVFRFIQVSTEVSNSKFIWISKTTLFEAISIDRSYFNLRIQDQFSSTPNMVTEDVFVVNQQLLLKNNTKSLLHLSTKSLSSPQDYERLK